MYMVYWKKTKKLKMSTSKHELVDFVEANKTVIGKKPDEHDSKESPGFPS